MDLVFQNEQSPEKLDYEEWEKEMSRSPEKYQEYQKKSSDDMTKLFQSKFGDGKPEKDNRGIVSVSVNIKGGESSGIVRRGRDS